MIFMGLDNGTSSCGLAVIQEIGTAALYPLPVKKELSYTKTVKNITRLDYKKFVELLNSIKDQFKNESFLLGIERPMINSLRFNASMSAIRCLEATLIAVEECEIPFQYIDSKEWQRHMLPHGLKGNEALKEASKQISKRMYPQINLKKDGDSLLIAEYLRRKQLNQLNKR